MKLTGLNKAACFALGIIAVSAFLGAQTPDRFFDDAPVKHEGVRLAVFYPSVGTIRNLEALRKTGALDVPGLVVIGVHHAREATDYGNARAYVREKGIDWFHFHAVSADIPEDALFRTNACTAEYERIFRASDGIIFFGGPDIPPAVFKEKTSQLTAIEDPVRHYFEVSAIFHLLGGSPDPSFKGLLEGRPDFPVLGICLGCQSLNVGTGGTLVQDIWDEVYGANNVEDILALDPQQWHNNPYIKLYPLDGLIGYNFHRIRLDEKGKFCAAMGFKGSDSPRILSSHHQALEKMGTGWRAIASSLDGKIVEAVEHERFPNVLGVQFHPEHRLLWESDPVHRQAPGDAPFSYKALLEGTPPSYDFNWGIWRWLGRMLIRASGPRA
jgi:putative glutamine amidotransferase